MNNRLLDISIATFIYYNLFQLYPRQVFLAMSDNLMEPTMYSSPMGVDELTPLLKVEQVMSHHSVETILIFQAQTKHCIGYIDNITVSKAIFYGLGVQPVKEFMNTNIIIATPTTSLKELFTIFIENQQPIIPISNNNEIITIIDKVKLLELSQTDKGKLSYIENSIKIPLCYLDTLVYSNLPTMLFNLLKEVGKLGDFFCINVFLVGGVVRDLLFNTSSIAEKTDIDFVVEGDASTFAYALVKKFKGTVRYTHNKLMTATVICPWTNGQELSIDIATARLEHYDEPGTLPCIEPTSIEQDLFRRDFTINAMALQLNQSYFGKLIDLFHGQKAIQNKSIDVIHSLSFIEDPTRIIRAIRFEQRYQFRISQQTEQYIQYALAHNVMEKLSGQRLFHEFKVIFKETKPELCIIRMNEFGVLAAIDKRFSFTLQERKLLYKIADILKWYQTLPMKKNQPNVMIIYFLALCYSFPREQIIQMLQKIGVEPTFQKKIFLTSSMVQNIYDTLSFLLKDKTKDKAKDKAIEVKGPISTIYMLLSSLSLEGLLFLQASSSIGYVIYQYLSLWRFIKPDITGNDLKKLGIIPGPQYRIILEDILKQKLDGNIQTKEEQLEYVCLKYNVSHF